VQILRITISEVIDILFDFVKNGPILFIGCHPDDVEIGCGGLLNRIKKKSDVYIITLSKNQVNPKHKNLIKEHLQSLEGLGIPRKNIILGDFKTREFSQHRQEILDYLLKLRKKINPTCIFTTPADLHQDHKVCRDEVLRVYRDKTVLEYFISRSAKYPTPNLFVTLTKKDIDAKVKALLKYKTYLDKNYMDKNSVIIISKFFGIKHRIQYCEAFTSVSIMI